MATARGINTMREAIISVYPGAKWRFRVEGMPDNQVIAIYNHFLRSGAFNKLDFRKKQGNECKQFTLEDYGIDLGRK